MEAQYLALAQKIGLGESKIIPELFRMIADLSEADLLLALPGTAAEMAEKFGTPADEMEKKLHHLFIKGLVFPSPRKTPTVYRACRDLVQFHDATILWPDAPRDFLDRWQDYMEEEWPDTAKAISTMLPRPFTRVIPVGVAVNATTHILAFEDIKEIIDKSRSLAVTNCTCRLIAHKCDKPLEACLQVNNAADYSIARGTGRELTKQQAMDLIRETEEAGLVHVVVNKQDVDHFICNCCACCCQTFPVLIKYGISVVEPSRFAALVDPELCTACETCLGRCFFGAITINDVAEIDSEKCLGCGLCQVTCPTEAITMKEIRQQDFVPEKLFG